MRTGGRDEGSRPGPRLVVERGGPLDPAEIAAVTIALTTGTTVAPRSEVPVWRRAAVLESAVGVELRAPGELRATERDRGR